MTHKRRKRRRRRPVTCGSLKLWSTTAHLPGKPVRKKVKVWECGAAEHGGYTSCGSTSGNTSVSVHEHLQNAKKGSDLSVN